MLNTRDAAAFLDVSPKTLRRYLRSHGWTKPAGEKDYQFTAKDVRKLKADMTPPTPRAAAGEVAWLNVDQGITIEEMQQARHDPLKRREVLARRRARHHSLRDRLLELQLWGTSEMLEEDL